MKTEKIQKLRFYLIILFIILLWYGAFFKAEIDSSFDFTSKIAFLFIGFLLIMVNYVTLINKCTKLVVKTYKEVDEIPYTEKVNELRFRIIIFTMLSFWLLDNIMIPIFEKYDFSNWRVLTSGVIYFLFLAFVLNIVRKYFKLIAKSK